MKTAASPAFMGMGSTTMLATKFMVSTGTTDSGLSTF